MWQFSLPPHLQEVQAAAVLEESKEKLGSWRRSSVENILAQSAEVADGDKQTVDATLPFRLYAASLIRDEHHSTEYFKLDLIDSQRRLISWLLFGLAAIGVSGLIVHLQTGGTVDALLSLSGDSGIGLPQLLIAIWGGAVGAVISALRSTMSRSSAKRIPEQLLSKSMTLARMGFGVPAGFLVIGLLQLGLIKAFTQGPPTVLGLLVLSFAAGYSERWVFNTLQGVGSDQT
jgi:hypothetical protein